MKCHDSLKEEGVRGVAGRTTKDFLMWEIWTLQIREKEQGEGVMKNIRHVIRGRGVDKVQQVSGGDGVKISEVSPGEEG